MAAAVSSAAALRRRWRTDTGRQLAHIVQRRIRDGDRLDGLGLGQVDGRTDLRGVVFTADITRFPGVRLHGIDFSKASLAVLHLVDCAIENCVFDAADCQFWNFQRSSVADCSFVEADLRRSRLGEWSEGKGNTFARTNFTSAKMQWCSTSAATYTDCNFSYAALNKVNFWQSSLIRCTFAGPLREVIFDGRHLGEAKPDVNPMEDVDFTDAVFAGCDFRGVRFDSVRLPSDPDLVLVRDPAVRDRAIAALPAVAGHPRAGLIHSILTTDRQSGGEMVVNLRDIDDGAADLLMSLLRTAGAPEPLPHELARPAMRRTARHRS